MNISRQHRIILILLVLYWLALIFFAHVPIPQTVRQADLSDKSLHFLAYLVLTFLFWFSFKPEQKVRWHKAAAWLTLFILTAYGIVDELVQSHIGRTCDAMDVAANAAGTFAALIILTFISFWPAALLVAAAVIFGVTNVARKNLNEVLPFAAVMFDLFAYAVFTFLWIVNMKRFIWPKATSIKWLIPAITAPAVFLLIVEVTTILLGRSFNWTGIIVPGGAIMATVAAIYIKNMLRRERNYIYQ